MPTEPELRNLALQISLRSQQKVVKTVVKIALPVWVGILIIGGQTYFWTPFTTSMLGFQIYEFTVFAGVLIVTACFSRIRRIDRQLAKLLAAQKPDWGDNKDVI